MAKQTNSMSLIYQKQRAVFGMTLGMTLVDDPRDFKNEPANTDFFSGCCGTEDYTLNFIIRLSFELVVTF